MITWVRIWLKHFYFFIFVVVMSEHFTVVERSSSSHPQLQQAGVRQTKNAAPFKNMLL